MSVSFPCCSVSPEKAVRYPRTRAMRGSIRLTISRTGSAQENPTTSTASRQFDHRLRTRSWRECILYRHRRKYSRVRAIWHGARKIAVRASFPATTQKFHLLKSEAPILDRNQGHRGVIPMKCRGGGGLGLGRDFIDHTNTSRAYPGQCIN